MSKIEARTLKGFRDYGPKEQGARQEMFRKIQSVFERFGFLPMSTPALEYKEILMGKYGDEEKLIYSFRDNGDRDVALRYDLTVPFARFMAQNENSLALPFKRYQIAPVWRAENTQKGRLREFYQCDVDVIGTESRLADAEVIACLAKTIEALGIVDYLVCINDRRNFEVLGEQLPEILRSIDKLNKLGLENVLAELRQKQISEDKVGLSREYMDGESVLKYNGELIDLRDQIISLGVAEKNIKIDQNIARGLDYYTSTVFEIVLTNNSEFGSIAGGGRYNDLLSTFSEKSMPAVGGSLGIDRLYEYLESTSQLPSTNGIEVMVLNMGAETWGDVLRVTSELRNANVNTDLYYYDAKLDKQFKYAESRGARLAIIIGEEEKAKGVVKIKNLQTREQVEVVEKDLLAAVRGA